MSSKAANKTLLLLLPPRFSNPCPLHWRWKCRNDFRAWVSQPQRACSTACSASRKQPTAGRNEASPQSEAGGTASPTSCKTHSAMSLHYDQDAVPLSTDVMTANKGPWEEYMEHPTEEERILVAQELGKSHYHRLCGVAKHKCKHGYPQAVVLPAFSPAGENGAATVHTGGPWLRCPLLQDKMTEWERAGSIEKYSKTVKRNPQLRQKVEEMHKVVAEERRHLIPEKTLQELEADPQQRLRLGTGLCGITKAHHVKCLHAHLADRLLRGKERNALGQHIMEQLQDEGYPVDGTDSCHRLCNIYARKIPVRDKGATKGFLQPKIHVLQTTPRPPSLQRQQRHHHPTGTDKQE
ncbi:BZIP domain-containing protein [Balamuthia mandrillaris]